MPPSESCEHVLNPSHATEIPYGPPKMVREDADRKEWAERRPYCVVCWVSQGQTWVNRFPGGIQIHEIIGGSMRSMEPCNYATLCSECHADYHSSGELKLEHILFAKWESTCLEAGFAFPYHAALAVNEEFAWNPNRLAWLRRPTNPQVDSSVLPSATMVPPKYLQERLRFRPYLQATTGLTESQFHSLGPKSVLAADTLEPTFPRIVLYTDTSGACRNCFLNVGKLAPWTASPSALSLF